jgi:hypothetical protein
LALHVIAFIAACIVVTAGAAAVLQFFLALDRSVRSAVEATWVFKLWRWCTETPGRWHERIAWERFERRERAAARRRVEIRDGTSYGPQRVAGGRVVPAGGDPSGPARPAPALQPDRSDPGHWVWVARPDFNAEADDGDRVDLDTSAELRPTGWWRCDEATRRGDLALVYRTAPHRDLRYVVAAESDAYPLDDQGVATSGGEVCDYRVLHTLDPPIPLADLQADPITARWQPVRVHFQRRVAVPPDVWRRLVTIIGRRDPRAGRLLREAAHGAAHRGPMLERELESRLFEEPERLRRIGLDVEAVGRRIRHPYGGLVDILFRDRIDGDYVVVALEPGRGGRAAVAQLLEDVAGVADLYETPPSVRGLLVAAHLDRRAALMLRGAGNLEFARLDELGLSVQEVAASDAGPARRDQPSAARAGGDHEARARLPRSPVTRTEARESAPRGAG